MNADKIEWPWCPVCHGKGKVPRLELTSEYDQSTEKCQECGGLGRLDGPRHLHFEEVKTVDGQTLFKLTR